MWTIIWFAARDTLADQLAAALADAPESRGWWYCDFHSDSQVTVVFAGRVFRYQRGNAAGRVEVTAYARSVGCPNRSWTATSTAMCMRLLIRPQIDG